MGNWLTFILTEIMALTHSFVQTNVFIMQIVKWKLFIPICVPIYPLSRRSVVLIVVAQNFICRSQNVKMFRHIFVSNYTFMEF